MERNEQPPARRDRPPRRRAAARPLPRGEAAGRPLRREELVALVREIRDAEQLEAARLAEQDARDAASTGGDDPDGLEERAPFFLRFGEEDETGGEMEKGAAPDP